MLWRPTACAEHTIRNVTAGGGFRNISPPRQEEYDEPTAPTTPATWRKAKELRRLYYPDYPTTLWCSDTQVM